MRNSALRWLPVLLLPLLTLGCVTPTGGTRPGEVAANGIIAQVCLTFRPITYSRLDTPETVEQVQAHNRAWTALCSTSNATPKTPAG